MPLVTTSTVRTYQFNNADGKHPNDAIEATATAGVQAGARSVFSTPRSELYKPQVGLAGSSQDYMELKKELLTHKANFEDPMFQAQDASLFFSVKPPRKFEWKRPHEICANPKFISDGASRFDVRQGELGDCWLLAAVASLSLHPQLFNQVIPENQDFDQNYCGLFRFKFWRFGTWQEVIVDDRLPTYNNKLVYMHSVANNEFWSALLEKAYSKMFGSYEALKGGSTTEAMEDFTGGISEFFDLRTGPPKNLFQIMEKAQQRCSLMGCSIEADPNKIEAELSNGLIMGHAYSITDVKMADIALPNKKGKIQLIRIRNPWGNEAEWKGAWSDKSQEWKYISDEEKKRLGITISDDGEFWMSFTDFLKNFQKVEICHLGPDSSDAESLSGRPKRKWEMCIEQSSWKRRLNAGGCRNYLNTFWTNPQFRITVVDPDEDDDENMGTIIVGLMQKDMRKKRKEGLEFHTIGYVIYKLTPSAPQPLEMNFFKSNASVAKSTFINTREITGRHKLPPGDYAIVPSTFEPEMEADFVLRIFSEKPNLSNEMDDVTTMVPVHKEDPAKIVPSPAGPDKTGVTVPAKTPQDEQQEKALRDSFQSIAGEDMEIDAYELRDILNAAFKKDFKFDGFSVETCRSMVAMMDYDQSGKLGFEEFKVMWTDLRLWKAVFKKHDADNSGNFNSYELREALNSVGFHVNNKIFNSLVMRFSTKQGVILFDDYILCCARLKTTFETFKAQKKDPEGNGVFNKDQFIQCIIYT